MRIIFLIFFLVSLSSSDILSTTKAYVVENYMIKQTPREFNMSVRKLNKNKKFALLEAVPMYADGSYVDTEYVEDVVFVLCLQKVDAKWKIIYDLSRADVPSKEEMKDIKNSFPSDFPKEFLSDFWQQKLENIIKSSPQIAE